MFPQDTVPPQVRARGPVLRIYREVGVGHGTRHVRAHEGGLCFVIHKMVLMRRVPRFHSRTWRPSGVAGSGRLRQVCQMTGGMRLSQVVSCRGALFLKVAPSLDAPVFREHERNSQAGEEGEHEREVAAPRGAGGAWAALEVCFARGVEGCPPWVPLFYGYQCMRFYGVQAASTAFDITFDIMQCFTFCSGSGFAANLVHVFWAPFYVWVGVRGSPWRVLRPAEADFVGRLRDAAPQSRGAARTPWERARPPDAARATKSS